jgi:hypothetical protein
MRFQIIAEVVGEAYADRPVAATFKGIDVEFRVDPSSHRVTHVALTAPADEIVPLLRGRPRPSGPTPTFTIPPMPRAEEMCNLFQYLESVGSFWLNCEQIKWGEPEFNWIAESDEEHELLDMFSFAYSRDYETLRVRVDGHLLQYILDSEQQLSKYTVPLAFFREGKREHTARRYVYAFMNFYFFLEDLFAQGKIKSGAVEGVFKQAPVLRAAADYALGRLQQDTDQSHLRALTKVATGEGCALTSTDGALELIVRMRGNLHHFSSASPKPKGHPLNQDAFEALSVFMHGVAVAVVADLMPGGGPGAPQTYEPPNA